MFELRDVLDLNLEFSIVDDKEVVGTFHKNTAKLILQNDNKKYNNLNHTEIELLDFGTWYVNNVTPNQEEGKIELELYDLSYRFDEDYIDDISFPISMKNWAQAICERRGVELGSLEFPNSDFVLNEKPFIKDGAKDRDVLKMIAGASCTYCQMIQNKFYFNWFNDNVLEFGDWYSLNQNDEKEAINLVVIGRGDVNDNIEYPLEKPEHPVEFRIDDNDILNFNREHMIIPIYEQINGFQYYPFKMGTYGNLKIIPGISAKYIDIDKKEVITPIMTVNLTFNGGNPNNSQSYTLEISSEELKETSTNHNRSGSIEKRIIESERYADKINAELVDVVRTQDAHTKQISEVKQDINSVQNLFQITGGSNDIRNSTGLFENDYWINSETGEFVRGYDSSLIGYTVSNSKIGVKNGITKTSLDNITNLLLNEIRNLSFKITNEPNTITTIRLKGNTTLVEEVIDYECELKEFSYQYVPDTQNLTLEIESTTNHDGWCYITDLMSNPGDKKSWEPARDEIIGTVLKLSQQGLTVYCTGSDIATIMTAQGFQVRRFQNSELYEVITEFTDKGITTKNIVCEKIEVKKMVTDVINVNGNDTVIMYLRSGL